MSGPTIEMEFKNEDDKRRFLEMHKEAKENQGNSNTLIVVAVAMVAGYFFLTSGMSIEDVGYMIQDTFDSVSGGGEY